MQEGGDFLRMRRALSILVLGLLFSTEVREIHGESGGCVVWGANTSIAVEAYDGEPVKVSCPLPLADIRTNHSMAHESGLTLSWYRSRQGEELDEPIDFRQAEERVSNEEEGLWFWPAFVNDSGNYTCMLRNASGCLRVSVSLFITQKRPNRCARNVELYLGDLSLQQCPGTSDFSPELFNMSTIWYWRGQIIDSGSNMLNNIDGQLRVNIVMEHHEGNYTCIVTVMRRGLAFKLTRILCATIAASQRELKPPILNQLAAGLRVEVEYGMVFRRWRGKCPRSLKLRCRGPCTLFAFSITVLQLRRSLKIILQGQEVNLTCSAFFHYILESPTTVQWSVDGRQAEELAPAMQVFLSEEKQRLRDKRITSTLNIRAVTRADIQRNYTCLAQNSKGSKSIQAVLVWKGPSYAIGLGCALGATLLIVVTSVAVYHFWWIEIVLFYRLYFGTDETIGDGKEYDAYVSYARSTEEEEFVLMTLQAVLENEYGYKICIYDRDSLPGGVITDETLACIWRSRRLVVVLSPNYLTNGTQALLELRAGMERMASTGQIRVILVEFRPVEKVSQVAELRRLKAVMATIKWRGEQSRDPKSKFWKQLRVSLPTRRATRAPAAKSSRLIYKKLGSSDLPRPLVSDDQSLSRDGRIGHEKRPSTTDSCPEELLQAESSML
ncbi:interleukin-1 receptor accessory protein-like isoform X2 [Hypanus sabinus]|uniref:interleukin-1 receptor accessory protein-like isoform X2 n=1 Tax=Hypanus sabinus TaxID=79690 RepID=UPI0028C4742C|nr:interleukin-1 receptor accessory protein-like isoform X2 [Hypanus sabinus]